MKINLATDGSMLADEELEIGQAFKFGDTTAVIERALPGVTSSDPVTYMTNARLAEGYLGTAKQLTAAESKEAREAKRAKAQQEYDERQAKMNSQKYPAIPLDYNEKADPDGNPSGDAPEEVEEPATEE